MGHEKRLVVCCDGTWNRPDQLSGGVVSPTNVSKLALGVAREDSAGTPQLLYYHHGVGTKRFERIRGGALGLGLSRNVRDCYRFLVENYEPGDQLYFFGFSRGAFTARSTVGLVRKAGILRPEHVGRIKDAYRLYRETGDKGHPNGLESRIFRRMYSDEEPDIHFVGVWDTVGSLGIPGLRGRLANRLWGFHDTALSSHVSFAYHALAIDEQRGPFKPTLWQQQEHAQGQTLEQVWFAGVHSDVGGGYPDCGLAEIPLLWMAQRAQACWACVRAGALPAREWRDRARAETAGSPGRAGCPRPDPQLAQGLLPAASSQSARAHRHRRQGALGGRLDRRRAPRGVRLRPREPRASTCAAADPVTDVS